MTGNRLILALPALSLVLLLVGSVLGAEDGKKGPALVTEKQSAEPSSVSPSAGEQINWHVISAGGNSSSANGYHLGTTIGQTAVGVTVSGDHRIYHGFWQDFYTGCCVIRGDVNDMGDGPDISDLVYLVDYIFLGGPAPPCMEAADINGDGTGPDISDLVYLVDYIFLGGPPPVPCP